MDNRLAPNPFSLTRHEPSHRSKVLAWSVLLLACVGFWTAVGWLTALLT